MYYHGIQFQARIHISIAFECFNKHTYVHVFKSIHLQLCKQVSLKTSNPLKEILEMYSLPILLQYYCISIIITAY